MRELRIGLIGLGTVGRGVLELLSRHGDAIARRSGATLAVTRATAKDLQKHQDLAGRLRLVASAEDIVTAPDVDLVIELAGGVDAPYRWVKSALLAKKSVITANKALLAAHGPELFALAREHGVELSFEAAVAGGIPILRALRESLAGDRITSLRGIVNGTSNFILSEMREKKLGFAEALADAQAKGYAEADPTLDVGGGDAAHKLVVLTMLAFGRAPALASVSTEGITHVEAVDIRFAESFGYVIKSLAIAREQGGALELRVRPTLVPSSSPLASVSGALNAVYVRGEAVGPLFFSGAGAGALPTASSVVGDLADLAHRFASGAPCSRLPLLADARATEAVRVSDPGEDRGRYYLRFTVKDRPGVLGRIASILGAHDVSIERLVQDGRSREDGPVFIVVLTHESRDHDVRAALAEIDSLAHIDGASRALKIDEE
jgi:homoserine dehydrogenase